MSIANPGSAPGAGPSRLHDVVVALGLDLYPARAVVAFFLLAAVAIGSPWLSGLMTIPWDAKGTFLPQIQFLAQSLADGQSPAWLPYAFSGHPQIADPQAMIFSPPFLVLALLARSPSIWAVDATLLGMIALSGVVLIFWFTDRGWHWAGGLVAALAFCYGASMAWRIQHIGQVLSLAYLPIVLLCLDRALDRRSIGYGVAAGLATGFMLLGRDQVALLAIYLLAAYAAWRLLGSEAPMAAVRGAVPPALAGGLACALLVAVPLLLTAQLAAESNRPEIDYAGAARGSLHPGLLLTLLAPNLYGAAGRMEDYWGPPSFAWQGTDLFVAQNMGVMYIGALPLLLLAFGALRGDLWRREIRFFTVATLLCLVYALGKYTPLFQLFYKVLPGVSLYRRPADATFLVGGFSAILAGYALSRLLLDPDEDIEHQERNVGFIGALLTAGAVACVLVAIAIDRVPLVWFPLGTGALSFAVAGAAFLFLIGNAHRRALLVALAFGTVTAADLGINNGPGSATALPVAWYDVLQPDSRNETIALLKARVVANETRRDRIELAGLGFHWPNASITHRLENTLGYNPLRLALYSRATGAEDHVGLPDQRKFSPLFPSYRSELANRLGLRFIVTGAPIETMDKRIAADTFPLVARTADGYVYENAQAMDRVRFVPSAQKADFEQMLRDGVWPAHDPKTTVLVEEIAPGSGPARRPGTARLLHYENTEVRIEADSPDGGWVVLHDLWHPWWRARLDGKATRIFRADVLFRAVYVPAGRHEVVFSFEPIAGALSRR